MILYNVTSNIDESIHEQWLHWMQKKHIPEILATGKFSSARLVRVLVEEEMGGLTYAVQYTCLSMENYERYKKEFAPALQSLHNAKFKDNFTAFRTLLEIIEK